MANPTSSRSFIVLSALLMIALVVLPVILSNHAGGAIAGMVLLILLFFFPGYLVLTLFQMTAEGTSLLLSFIVGICCVTTAYSFFASAAAAFSYFVLAVSFAGILVFLSRIRLPVG